MAFLDTVLYPLEVVVAWIMVGFHSFFTWIGLGSDSGNSWVLSIVGLVIVMRIVLIPLFVKQIKASRGLQLIQPEMQKLQKKYKGKTDPASREAMSRETMALYRKHGTNPFASCLPILAQSPIFFALFRVLNSLTAVADGTLPSGRTSIGPLTPELAASAESSTLFGAPLSSTFMRAAEYGPPDYPPGTPTSIRIVTVILIILMSVTTFTTQRQLTMKNMPAAALDNPMARQQRMLMYILPLVFAVSGINFPIGVLVYWFTTNLWSMGQQFYVIRRMPAPGSEAEAAQRARKAKRAKRHGVVLEETAPEVADETKPVAGQRVQPVRKDRRRPAPRPGATPGDRPTSGSQATPGSEPTSASQQRAAAKPPADTQKPASGQRPTGSQAKGGAQGTKGSGQGTKGSGQGGAKPKPQGGGAAGTGGTGTNRPAGQRAPRTTASGERTSRPSPTKPAAPRRPETPGPTTNRPPAVDDASGDAPTAP
jgi:YidC/Oxa1 family membrane protein insertase